MILSTKMLTYYVFQKIIYIPRCENVFGGEVAMFLGDSETERGKRPSVVTQSRLEPMTVKQKVKAPFSQS